MDLNFYTDLTDGTGHHDGDPEFLDPQTFNGFDSDNKVTPFSRTVLVFYGRSSMPLNAPQQRQMVVIVTVVIRNLVDTPSPKFGFDIVECEVVTTWK